MSRKGKKEARPLQWVTARYLNEYGLVIEILECGHEQRQRKDIAGPTNAVRRRCRKCPPRGGGFP